MKPYEGTEAYKAGFEDGKKLGWFKHYSNGFEDGYKAGRTGWIPMESGLPDEEGLYLVAWLPTDRKCVYDHYYGLLQWDGDNWENAVDRTGKPMRIIAWRKLPDFYKEGEESEVEE